MCPSLAPSNWLWLKPCLKQPNISFSQHLDNDILQTLSTHNAAAGSTITGFLYVPDLTDGDPCVDISSQYIPSNVTRRANLPPTDFTLIALAPWISVECTQSYLASAKVDPARAFLFYLIDNGTFDASAQPPPINSPAWTLNDGGAWRSGNPFPIYAIPADFGNQLIHELSLYSGNMTNVPNGHRISELADADPRDYVRMYTAIDTSNSSSLPSLWVFLLIVIGILVAMLFATSATMHLIQRARRNALRRRIINQEVDLEALGIKRLTVPREVIDKLPLFTYNCEDEKLTEQTTVVKPDNSREGSQSAEDAIEDQEAPQNPGLIPPTNEVVTNQSSLAHKFLPYPQPTCPICLEDFKSEITPIRELPCGHIFDPECIDSFLCNNSSLCPICKKSVLPVGYCPTQITNAIVRRERNLRRLRSRVTVNEERHIQRSESRIHGFGTGFRRILQRPSGTGNVSEVASSIPLQSRPALVADTTTLHPRASVSSTEIPPTQDTLDREEVSQRRIQELAAGQPPIIADEAIDGRGSKCTLYIPYSKLLLILSAGRRIRRKVFPGF